MAGAIYSGDLFAAELVNGVAQGLLKFGNATKFEIKENSDIKTRKSKQRGDYGSAKDTVAIKSPADLSIMIDDFDEAQMRAVFLAQSADVSRAILPVVDESHAVPTSGDFYITLNHSNVSALTVTGLVAGDDYELVDASSGLVKVIGTGAAVVGTPILVSYTSAAQAGVEVSGGLRANRRFKFVLIGENLANGDAVRVEVFNALVTPNNGVDFLSEEFVTVDLSGIANAPDDGLSTTPAYKVTQTSTVTT